MNHLHIFRFFLGALFAVFLGSTSSHAQTEKTDSLAADSLRLLL